MKCTFTCHCGELFEFDRDIGDIFDEPDPGKWEFVCTNCGKTYRVVINENGYTIYERGAG